jgi:hypothetical protein
MVISFFEWVKKMAGTGIVMGNPCKTPKFPDAQVWGDPASSCKKKKKKKKK